MRIPFITVILFFLIQVFVAYTATPFLSNLFMLICATLDACLILVMTIAIRERGKL